MGKLHLHFLSLAPTTGNPPSTLSFHTANCSGVPCSNHFEPPPTSALAVQTPQGHEGLLTLLLLLASVLSLSRTKLDSDLHLPAAVIMHCKRTALGGDLSGWRFPSPPFPRTSRTAYGQRGRRPSPCYRKPTPDSLFPARRARRGQKTRGPRQCQLGSASGGAEAGASGRCPPGAGHCGVAWHGLARGVVGAGWHGSTRGGVKDPTGPGPVRSGGRRGGGGWAGAHRPRLLSPIGSCRRRTAPRLASPQRPRVWAGRPRGGAPRAPGRRYRQRGRGPPSLPQRLAAPRPASDWRRRPSALCSRRRHWLAVP